MKCNELQKIIDKSYDSPLSKEEKKLVLHHIESCASCKAEYDFALTYKGSLANSNGPKMPEGLRDDFLKQAKSQQLIKDKNKSKQKRPLVIAYKASAIAAVLLLLFISADILGQLGAEVPEQPQAEEFQIMDIPQEEEPSLEDTQNLIDLIVDRIVYIAIAVMLLVPFGWNYLKNKKS
ncbi:zf-HC2 domain-containing protein [Proteinivorax hydrogeniformans]|uniref:Zf-HC2 domain-containing protein n=1 Tax=Proteinivorax hydrogeniformans TaxID=1826727 RepID=A0AAU8HRB7_9FIRM